MANFQPTLLAQLDAIPPFLCYAIAHSGRRKRPTLAQLAKESGLSERTFVRIARKFSWADVKVADCEAFCRACRVNMLRQNAHRKYLRQALRRQTPITHLSRQQFATFAKQCKQWQEMKAAKVEKAAGLPTAPPAPTP